MSAKTDLISIIQNSASIKRQSKLKKVEIFSVDTGSRILKISVSDDKIKVLGSSLISEFSDNEDMLDIKNEINEKLESSEVIAAEALNLTDIKSEMGI
jgi:hypothetical protein